MDASFVYSDLDRSRREIRLLSILPGQLSDPIACQLESHFLDDNPVYEALSYVWGDTSNRPQIHLGKCTVPVTRNLYKALQYLRKPDETRVMWIDALCINQKNPKEQSHQVALMHKIFSDAVEVICWLATSEDHGISASQGKALSIHEALSLVWGDGTDWSAIRTYGTSDPELLNKCMHFRETVELEKGTPQIQYTGPDQSNLNKTLAAFALLYLLAARSAQRGALSELPCFARSSGSSKLEVASRFADAFRLFQGLVEAPWWDRIWILQEAVVAANITVVHHHITIPWAVLQDAAFHVFENEGSYKSLPFEQCQVFYLLRHRVHTIGRWRMPGGYRGIRYRLPRETLLELLDDFWPRKATDARDKVYALLGLVKRWDISDPVTPDYSATTAQAYIRATISLIREEKSLIALEGRSRAGNIHQLPSWVQDWSGPPVLDSVFRRVGEDDHLYHAGGSQVPEPRLCCDTILILEGLQVDTVKMVSCAYEPGADLGRTMLQWENDICSCGLSFDEPYINGQPLLDALRSTLAADLLNSSFRATRIMGMFGGPPPPFERDFSGKANAKNGVDWSAINDNPEHIYDVIVPVIRDHRLFVTERGFMGIADLGWCPLAARMRAEATVQGVASARPLDKFFSIARAPRVRFLMIISFPPVPLGTVCFQCRWVLYVSSAVGYCIVLFCFIGAQALQFIAPRTACIGDSVFVLKGGPLPFILRPGTPAEGDCSHPPEYCFELVGSCYVHGIMDGEALKSSATESHPVHLL